MRRTTRLLAATAAASLLLAACGGDEDGDDAGSSEDTGTEETAEDDGAAEETGAEDTGDEEMTEDEGSEAAAGDYELVSDGTLTVCSDAPYEPFEFEDASAPSGFSGFDIDLVQAMADLEGLDLTVVVTGFDGIQSGTALAAGTCDVAASAMTITEEREQNLDFLEPYYDADQSLLSTTDGPQSLDDVTSLGVQAATTGALYASENFEGQITEFPDEAALSSALSAGTVEAILQDLPVNLANAETNDDWSVVETYSTEESYGFAVAEGNTALADVLNARLQELRDNGTYDEVYGQYFDLDA